jgi:hypothetical protein
METYTFNNWSQLNKEENITYKLQTMRMKGTFLWMNTINIDFHYTYVILGCRVSLLKAYNAKAILSIPANPEKSPTASSDLFHALDGYRNLSLRSKSLTMAQRATAPCRPTVTVH